MHDMAWKESLRDRWILANCKPSDIRFIYCDRQYWGDDALNWESLRQYRKNHRDDLLLLRGSKLSPEFSTPEQERERVRKQRQRVAPKTGGAALKLVAMQIPPEVVPHVEALVEAWEQNGPLTKATFSEYEMGYKDADGEAQTHKLHAKKFEVKFDTEHQEIINALRDIKPVKAPKLPRSRRKEVLKAPDAPRNALVGGDFHFGYLRMEDGELIPTHDEDAIDVFHQVAKDLQPDKIMLGGDNFDFAGLSRWEQLGIFIDTLNPTLERIATFLDTLNRDCPNTNIIWVEGNHEERMPKMRRTNPQVGELLKMRIPGQKHPVLSVPHLLELDERGVEFLRGGQARAEVNGRIGLQHQGNDKKSLGRKLVSTIGFDRHSPNMPRPEVIETPFGTRTIYHYTLGMMGRVDGILPSWMSTYDHAQRPDTAVMNWVQMFGVVNYLEGDEPFQVHVINTNPHDGYKTFYNGKTYRPTPDTGEFA